MTKEFDLRAKETTSRTCSKRCKAWNFESEAFEGITKNICKLRFAEISGNGMAYPGEDCPCYADVYQVQIEETYYQDYPLANDNDDEDEVGALKDKDGNEIGTLRISPREQDNPEPQRTTCGKCDYFDPNHFLDEVRCCYELFGKKTTENTTACQHFTKIGYRLK
jgi:hypothetical protein